MGVGRHRELLLLFLLMSDWPTETETRCSIAAWREALRRWRWRSHLGPGHIRRWDYALGWPYPSSSIPVVAIGECLWLNLTHGLVFLHFSDLLLHNRAQLNSHAASFSIQPGFDCQWDTNGNLSHAEPKVTYIYVKMLCFIAHLKILLCPYFLSFFM